MESAVVTGRLSQPMSFVCENGSGTRPAPFVTGPTLEPRCDHICVMTSEHSPSAFECSIVPIRRGIFWQTVNGWNACSTRPSDGLSRLACFRGLRSIWSEVGGVACCGNPAVKCRRGSVDCVASS